MQYNIEYVIDKYIRKNKLKYIFFWGHQPSQSGDITKSCFSQWWMSDFKIGKITYTCMEQYMMAEKARLFNDIETLELILKSSHPKQMKDLGRKVSNFNDALWNKKKYDIVLKGNFAKFFQNEDLREFLLNTNNRILVEASPYDKIWGIGMAADNGDIENPTLWKGQNLLGFALMEVRDEIKKTLGNTANN